MRTRLLILGKPNSSKSTFIAQFYSKLLKRESNIILDAVVENITPIKEARQALANGLETTTTPTDKNVELLLPILIDEKKVDLYMPDYGGEQIKSIIEKRGVDKKWADAINESNNWILFIRITNISTAFDLSNKTILKEQIESKKTYENELYSISDQSFFIELLQIILDFKKYNYHFKNNNVKLTLVLTCWDELDTQEKPKEVLSRHLPLLLNFIESNWEKDKYKIFGLSAQGFSLTKFENKELYQTEGSEKFAYIINEDGNKINDVTELIKEAL